MPPLLCLWLLVVKYFQKIFFSGNVTGIEYHLVVVHIGVFSKEKQSSNSTTNILWRIAKVSGHFTHWSIEYNFNFNWHIPQSGNAISAVANIRLWYLAASKPDLYLNVWKILNSWRVFINLTRSQHCQFKLAKDLCKQFKK